MEMNVEEGTISDAAVQTDLVSSPILWQCLYVLRTVPEFRNLTYKVTKSSNDVEMLVVYREGVLGIFGVPIDPFTLTLDPKGKCSLSIAFRPVQRVSIVSSESGHIEIASLLALLRMIAGNGYLFCPGIPEKFLAGKACGKFVVLHKVPFKRYQSSQCPVYYQTQMLQPKSTKSSLCALCPRCLQAAKWIQSLPFFRPNGTGRSVQQQTQLAVIGQLKQDERNSIQGSSISNNCVTQEVNSGSFGNPVLPASFSKLLTLTNLHSSSLTSVAGGPKMLNIETNINRLNQKTSSIDVNGNSRTADILKGSNCALGQNANAEDYKRTSMNEKLLDKRSFLRNLLQEMSRKKSLGSADLSTETKGVRTSNVQAGKESNDEFKKSKKRHKNICRHCKKEFSSPANLMNHIQRHEALSGSWHRQFRERNLQRSRISSILQLRVALHGLKLSSVLHRRKPVQLSETSLRLFQKYLDDLLPSHNRVKSLKQQGHIAVKNYINEAEKQVELESKRFEQTDNEALEKRFPVKRTASGLSPMQTLLEAAAIAEVGQEDVSSPTISSSSSLALGKHHEVAVMSTTSRSPITQTELVDACVPEKKPRKSSKLAPKRVKRSKRKIGNEDTHNETIVIKNVSFSENNSLLSNLNLLSNVSLETATRQLPANTKNPVTVSCFIPTTLSSELKTRAAAVSTSHSVDNPLQMHKNTSEGKGNALFFKESQGNEPFTNVNVSSFADFPPLPPLLFAKSVQGMSSVCPFPSQKQQTQPQSLSVTPCLLRNLVTVGNSQPATLRSLEATPKTDVATLNDCGAMDLSKPKPSQATTNIPLCIEKNNTTAFSGLPHHIIQMVKSKDSPKVLQHLMMMTKSADVSVQEYKVSVPLTAVTNNKQVASGPQACLFDSTFNYKIDKGVKNTPQMQAVVTKSSCLTPPGKAVKAGGGLAVQGDEIQCGYKWTGSGGLVKERTQAFRELVPSHIMTNFLSKTWPSTIVTQPISVNLSNTSKPQLPSPQPVLSSESEKSTPSKPHDLSTSHHAQSLTMSKLSEVPVLNKGTLRRSRKSATKMVISLLSPVGKSTLTSPGSTEITILKSASANSSGALNQCNTHLSVPTNGLGRSTTSSPQKLQLKGVSLSQSISPSLSLLKAASIPSSGCTKSSPSLAALLSQPATSIHDHDEMLRAAYHSVTSPTLSINKNTTVDSSVISCPENGYVKMEPLDPHSPEQGTVIMTLPFKTENEDPDKDKVESAANQDGDRSPTSLVVDLSPDSTTSSDKGKTLTWRAFHSRAADFTSKNTSLKCEH